MRWLTSTVRTLADRALARLGYIRADVFDELIELQDQAESFRVLLTDARAQIGELRTMHFALSHVVGARLSALEHDEP